MADRQVDILSHGYVGHTFVNVLTLCVAGAWQVDILSHCGEHVSRSVQPYGGVTGKQVDDILSHDYLENILVSVKTYG